jgi:hypothetical protein
MTAASCLAESGVLNNLVQTGHQTTESQTRQACRKSTPAYDPPPAERGWRDTKGHQRIHLRVSWHTKGLARCGSALWCPHPSLRHTSYRPGIILRRSWHTKGLARCGSALWCPHPSLRHTSYRPGIIQPLVATRVRCHGKCEPRLIITSGTCLPATIYDSGNPWRTRSRTSSPAAPSYWTEACRSAVTRV